MLFLQGNCYKMKKQQPFYGLDRSINLALKIFNQLFFSNVESFDSYLNLNMSLDIFEEDIYVSSGITLRDWLKS